MDWQAWLDGARLGTARRGAAGTVRSGKTRRGGARYGRQGEDRLGDQWHGRHGSVRFGRARSGVEWHGIAGMAAPGTTWHEVVRQGKARQCMAGKVSHGVVWHGEASNRRRGQVRLGAEAQSLAGHVFAWQALQNQHMKKAFDMAEVIALLRRGIAAGHWTLQDLDVPSRGWVITMEDAKRIPGFTPPTYRNPLRDEPTTTERVEVVSPRDFPLAAATPDPVQRGGPSLLLGADGAVAESFSDAGVQRHEGCVGDEANHGDQTHLGAAWESGASGVGELSDDW